MVKLKLSKLLTVVLCIALVNFQPIVAYADVTQPSTQSVLTDSSQFDPEVFKTRAEEIFGNVVKGYSLAIVRNGTLVGATAGGVAVDGNDTPFPVPMDISTPANVGSTAKMASSVALLSFFEKEPSASIDEWLDREIINYFPELWREALLTSNDPQKNAVDQVTFRHLLQHKTGLKEEGVFMEDGVNPTAIGNVRNYENDNIKILTYILPYVVDPEFGTQVDQKAQSEGITQATWNDFYNQELATYFGNYMQRNFFDKVSIQAGANVELPSGLWKERLVPSCDHKTTYAGTPYFRNEAWGRSGDIPLNGDIDGDGADDLVIWRPSNGQWFVRTVSGETIVRELPWGQEGDIPLIGDVNGDGTDDFIIWRPSNGHWFVVNADGSSIVRDFPWGTEGDIPFIGDVNGNGTDDFIVWRPSKGEWYASEANGQDILRELPWGVEGDIPLVGDVNGDGASDFIIWRPSEGEWYASEANGQDIIRKLSWGVEGDIPLVGDINGDGADEFVIFRSSTGQWFARKGDGQKEVLFRNVRWGGNNVEGTGSIIPLLSDLSGDGKDNLLVFRSSAGKWSAAGRRYALGYASKNDMGSGSPAENIPEPPGCYAQGGYWFSSAEYAAWVANFGFGNTFVSQNVRDMMFDTTTENSLNNRLGWSNVFDTQQSADFSFVTDQFGIRYLPYHGGADRNFRSAIIRLPDGYYAFAVANSPDRGSTSIARGILRAWIAAMGGS